MTIQKIKSGRVTSVVADEFIGDRGQIFYNEELGDLRLSDGVTVGGILLATGGSGGGGGTPLLPATTTRLGGIKVGSGLLITAAGILSVNPSIIPPTYILPIATKNILGGVKVDGTTITIDGNGVISGTSQYELPTASTSTLGGVKVDGTSITINNGIISATPTINISGNAGTVTNGVYTTGSYADPVWITSLSYSKLTGTPTPYSLPTASTTILGGVKVDGTTITINNGVISGATTYTLPTASTSTLGGVKVDGSTITITNGIISATQSDITGNAGTVTNGVYTTGHYANPDWITSLDYSKITNTPTPYSLPTATTTILGGVKIDGTTITIDSNGVISGATTYTLPISTDSILGGVKIGSGINVDSEGIISVTPYSLPTATDSILGGVKVDGTTITIDSNGVISSTGGGSGTYTLPTASTITLGGVKIDGTTITIDSNGVISGATTYTLPTATTTDLGGVKIDGTTITINDGVISATPTDISGNAGTVTNGVYTTGSYADPSWITSLSYSKLTGTPTPYSLPTASTSTLGGVKVDGTTITINNGVISGSTYTLPTASSTQLGGVKIGTGLLIDQSGVVSVNIPSIQANPLTIKSSGTVLTTETNSINFTGAGVTTTVVGNDVTVNIPSGGSGGITYAMNIDGGVPGSVYGGIDPIDGGYI